MIGSRREIHVARCCPPGYVHGRAFDEVLESLCSGLRELGFDVSTAEDRLEPSRLNIVLGAHLLDDQGLDALRSHDVILYNFEQLDRKSTWMRRAYIDALAACRTWDYSRRNIAYLRTLRPSARPEFVPLGYCANWTGTHAMDQDIDVLFYGSMNERRKQTLDALKSAGLNVHAAFGVYGKERDALVARAKVVLNVHFYDTNILEVVRVAYLMANSKAVVSECAAGTEVYDHLRDGLRLVPYDKIVEACVELVRDCAGRRALEHNALAAVMRRTAARELLSCRSIARELPSSARPSVPRWLNLGSGKDWRADCLNVDIHERVQPDLLQDICKTLPFGKATLTERFADFCLEPGSFDRIIANDVLEHLPDLVSAMGSCLALLAVGGEMHIQVPYDLSYGAWQDPTHVRAFNERSWLYFTDWHWYLGWSEARFTKVREEFVLSPVGGDLKARGVSDAEILRTPRAVDSMRVVLRKITIDEPVASPVT